MARRSQRSRLGRVGAGIADSAHDVWLAGLGALAVTVRGGERLFRRLVDRGREVEHDGLSSLRGLSLRGRGAVEGLRAGVSRAVAAGERRVTTGAKALRRRLASRRGRAAPKAAPAPRDVARHRARARGSSGRT